MYGMNIAHLKRVHRLPVSIIQVALVVVSTSDDSAGILVNGALKLVKYVVFIVEIAKLDQEQFSRGQERAACGLVLCHHPRSSVHRLMFYLS